MARDQRKRSVRRDEQEGSRPVQLNVGRRFQSASGNDQAVRQARALQGVFGAGTQLYGDILKKRNAEGETQAVTDFATGNKDMDQKTKGYLEAWDKLEAERDVNDLRMKLPELLRGANWEQLTEDEVQELIDGQVSDLVNGVDPKSAYASVFAPGALALNTELIREHKEMQLKNIQLGQQEDLYANLNARFAQSAQLDENGKAIPGSEQFDYDYLSEQTNIFWDGPDKRTKWKELLFHFAIENGRPEIIEQAPERFGKDGKGDPTGIRENLDEYREALNAARRGEAARIKAAEEAKAAANEARVQQLQWSIYEKRMNGQNFNDELRELYGMSVAGEAEFSDFTAAKNFGDSQFDEREEHAPDYGYVSAMWTDIYNGAAGIRQIYKAREEGALGFGKTADDLMQKMMSTVERITPNREAISSPEVTQLRSQLASHYNPSMGGPTQALDQTRFHVKNLALDDYNTRVINGEDPTDAYNAVRQKYDAVITNTEPSYMTKTISSAEFVASNIITPQAISDVIDGKQDWQTLSSGIPQHVWVPILIEGVNDGTITEEQLEKLGIEL